MDNASFCRRSTSGATTRWNLRCSTIERARERERNKAQEQMIKAQRFRFGPSNPPSLRPCLSEAKRQISVNWTNWKCKKKYIKMKFLKKNCGGTRPTLYGIVYGILVLVATCSCSLCSLIIRFDGPVGHKHVSLQETAFMKSCCRANLNDSSKINIYRWRNY